MFPWMPPMKDTTKFREKSPPSFSFAVSSDQGLEDGEDQGSHDKTHVSGALGHNPSASFGMAAEGDVSIFFGGVYEVAINNQYNQFNFNTVFFLKLLLSEKAFKFLGADDQFILVKSCTGCWYCWYLLQIKIIIPNKEMWPTLGRTHWKSSFLVRPLSGWQDLPR